jgi:FtsZ-binding cell division protein ZapB
MATPQGTLTDQADALQSLEERIFRAVELIAELRSKTETLQAENARLSAELETMTSERSQVRSRIEKLLGQLDNLAS